MQYTSDRTAVSDVIAVALDSSPESAGILVTANASVAEVFLAEEEQEEELVMAKGKVVVWVLSMECLAVERAVVVEKMVVM